MNPAPKTRPTIPAGMFQPIAGDGTADPLCMNCLPVTTCDHKRRSEHNTRISRGGHSYVGGCTPPDVGPRTCGCRRFALALALAEATP